MENLEKHVKVRFDRTAHTLTIDPAEVQVRDREWVRWEFEGLLEGEFGFISFAPPLPRLGPFNSLRSFDSVSVLGKGNKGTAAGGAYGYRALLLSPDEPEALASAVGMVINIATEENTAPEIHVRYKEADATHPLPYLEVSPDPVGLNTGDTATWRFANLPPNAFACFKFETVVPGMSEGRGPFIAFSASRGADPDTIEANGTGFSVTMQEPPEHFSYRIELRDWAGRRLASHDPQIDNLGPLPTPP
jgi:hypothetical protein